MAHPKCTRTFENPVVEQQNCGKGPKLGFQYLPTCKTLHCWRTAGALRARHSHSRNDSHTHSYNHHYTHSCIPPVTTPPASPAQKHVPLCAITSDPVCTCTCTPRQESAALQMISK